MTASDEQGNFICRRVYKTLL